MRINEYVKIKLLSVDGRKEGRKNRIIMNVRNRRTNMIKEQLKNQ